MKLEFEIKNSEKNFFYNLPAGSEVFLLIDMARKSSSGVVHICKNDQYLEKISELIQFFSNNIKVFELPAWDTNPYDKVSPNNLIISQRLETLTKISNGLSQNQILLTTANAITQRFVPSEKIKNSSITISKVQTIKREDLLKFLVNNSYVNISNASEHGEFAVRGSIIDIFPSNSDFGIRVDFFGDEIESIRKYDPLTQITIGTLESFEIIPASEILLDQEHIDKFKQNYLKEFGIAASTKDPLFEAISEGRKYAGYENYLPFFYEKLETIFDYCKQAIFTFEDDIEQALKERFERINDSYSARIIYGKSDKYSGNENFIKPEKLYVLENEFQNYLTSRTHIYFNKFNKISQNKNSLEFNYRQSTNYSVEAKLSSKSASDILRDQIIEDVKNSRKIKTIIACMSDGSRERMGSILKNHEINYVVIENFENEQILINNSNIGLCTIAIDSGFEAENIRLISEADLLGEKIWRKKSSKTKKAEDFIKEASNLNSGELVVHKEYGIGMFKGLETLKISDTVHDFVLIVYRDGDKLYVPVENIDIITRFGSESEGVELDKLGGLNWQERTARIKKRVKVLAEELIKIAAQRELTKAEIFDVTSGSYEEFCAKFPYSETEDQINAVTDVIHDISSGKTMDRLICGDVGFGKTEVALRAAFAITMNNNDSVRNQVILICPTTLLCRQHFSTFSERFKNTGLVIKQLSRMVSRTELKKTREAVKNGEVDIIVGTHALLASQIEFKNLALVIVDEEQRFGVAQKEKLKKLKTGVHVLTLSATPIPRTLQLSLSGIRDLSLIATPPIDRLAVRTFVMIYDDISIREAILKEHYRGGSTYFIVPKIKDISDIEKRLREIIPEVKIAVAHGQMNSDELDKIMTDFAENNFDVLISTTIVESGLDIPSANTIIIYNADTLGLAQLYQLRGRVGRGKLRGYAYLTIPARKAISHQAEKRLNVMQKLDSLGAGFSLASYDMDIRGFGNLLGEEQSGNIKEVGIELYQNMLKEAVEGLKTSNDNIVDENYSIKLNLGISVLIPENFITDSDLRMGLYRRLANLENEAEIESFAVEIVDRFGKIPTEVENLLETVKIKLLCRKLEITKIDAGDKGAVIQFHNNKFSSPEALIELVSKNPIKFKIKDGDKFVIVNRDWSNLDYRVQELKKILLEIYNFTISQHE